MVFPADVRVVEVTESQNGRGEPGPVTVRLLAAASSTSSSWSGGLPYTPTVMSPL